MVSIAVSREDGGPAHEYGRVLDWEPPEHLRFEWRLSNFGPGERTEVDVRFETVGESTQVTVDLLNSKYSFSEEFLTEWLHSLGSKFLL